MSMVIHDKAVYEEEQRNYYILSSFWAELDKDQVLGEPVAVQSFDMHTCTLQDVQVRGREEGTELGLRSI